MVPVGWIIGCPLLGFVSDRIGRRKPVIIGGESSCSPRSPGSSSGARGLFPPYVLGLVAGIASGAAMLPYTVIKEANPPELSGTATGVVNFLNFTFSALLTPVFGWVLVRVAGGLPQMQLEDYQTTFAPLLLGVALATLLTFFLKETGPAIQLPEQVTARGNVMDRTTGTGKYEALLTRCRSLEPVPTAVAHPCEETALAGAIEAARAGAHRSRFSSGPRRRSARSRRRTESRWAELRIVDAPHSHASAAKAVELVRQGEAELLMKGSLHSDELARCCRGARDRAADRPPHQPRVHHGRPDLPQGPGRHRRGDQHRADARGQGRTSARTPSISR